MNAACIGSEFVDFSGNDVIFLCRTLDGTKDTGGGATIQFLVNPGTIYYRGSEALIQTYLDTTKYIQRWTDNAEGIDCNHDNFVLENIQLEPVGASADHCISIIGSDNCIIRGNLIDASGHTRSGRYGVNNQSNTNTQVYNNFFNDITSICVAFINSTNGGFYNNTFIDGGGIGVYFNAGSTGCTLRNNIINSAAANNYYFEVAKTSSNNISSDATSPDVAFRNISLTFENKGALDFRLAAGDTEAIDAGADVSGVFTVDFFGTTRSGWSIGAHEYGAAAGGASVGVMSKRDIHSLIMN